MIFQYSSFKMCAYKKTVGHYMGYYFTFTWGNFGSSIESDFHVG